MRFTIRLICSIYLLSLSIHSKGQIIYHHDTSMKVYAYGKELTLAFSGGFNTPQFSMGDINNDGLKDLVEFEPGLGVKTFINLGTVGNPNYRYAPEY